MIDGKRSIGAEFSLSSFGFLLPIIIRPLLHFQFFWWKKTLSAIWAFNGTTVHKLL